MNVVIDKRVADEVLRPFKPIQKPTPEDMCTIGMWAMELEIVEQSEEHFTRKFQMAL